MHVLLNSTQCLENNLSFGPPIWQIIWFLDVSVWKSLENWQEKITMNHEHAHPY